jgi:N-acyl-D-aspartate/D-glutamate deacylase
VAGTLTHPAALISNSDAGAHLAMMCASVDTTLLLTKFVRDRRDMTVEFAVNALTVRQAELLGLGDRGVLAPGMRADVNVFTLGELDWAADEFVADIPGGGSRLRRPAGGYPMTMIDGVVTCEDGKDTGNRPGRVLRAGSDA